MIEKIWIVTQESNVDGEIMFNVTPCICKETAKQVFEQGIDTILKESCHFGGYTKEEREELFEVEDKGDGRFFITDPYDDYYEEFLMYEKDIQY